MGFYIKTNVSALLPSIKSVIVLIVTYISIVIGCNDTTLEQSWTPLGNISTSTLVFYGFPPHPYTKNQVLASTTQAPKFRTPGQVEVNSNLLLKRIVCYCINIFKIYLKSKIYIKHLNESQGNNTFTYKTLGYIMNLITINFIWDKTKRLKC